VFTVADVKWGAPEFGESGGIVQWNMDLSTGLLFDDALYSQSDFETAVRTAFSSWEDVADINFVESLSDAEVTVEMGSLPGDTIGLARLTYMVLPETDQFINADIILDTDEEWAPFGETDLNFYAVAAHEIGHALGLLHVDDPTQLMNAILFASDLGEGDIEGAREIYGDAPVQVFDTTGESGLSFFERFFDLILSIFGLGSSSTIAATRPAPWADTDLPDLADIIPITEILDDTGEPYDIETDVHAMSHPDSDQGHPPGCGCGCGCGADWEFA
jgi:hypothetical protein